MRQKKGLCVLVHVHENDVHEMSCEPLSLNFILKFHVLNFQYLASQILIFFYLFSMFSMSKSVIFK